MESLFSLPRMRWDHEPWKAPASRTHSKRFAKSQALGHCAAAFGVGGACSRFRTRFMESLLSRLRMHWDHEPTPNPSQEGNFRGAGECLLPSWEGSGVGRFMERHKVRTLFELSRPPWLSPRCDRPGRSKLKP